MNYSIQHLKSSKNIKERNMGTYLINKTKITYFVLPLLLAFYKRR